MTLDELKELGFEKTGSNYYLIYQINKNLYISYSITSARFFIANYTIEICFAKNDSSLFLEKLSAFIKSFKELYE